MYVRTAPVGHTRPSETCAGLSSSPRRGYWQLTQQGLDFVREHAAPLSQKDVEKLAVGFNDVRLAPQPGEEQFSEDLPVSPTPDRTAAVASPDDRLGDALAELRRTVAAELREALACGIAGILRNRCTRRPASSGVWGQQDRPAARRGYWRQRHRRYHLARQARTGKGLRVEAKKMANNPSAGLKYRDFMVLWPGSVPQRAYSLRHRLSQRKPPILHGLSSELSLSTDAAWPSS